MFPVSLPKNTYGPAETISSIQISNFTALWTRQAVVIPVQSFASPVFNFPHHACSTSDYLTFFRSSSRPPPSTFSSLPPIRRRTRLFQYSLLCSWPISDKQRGNTDRHSDNRLASCIYASAPGGRLRFGAPREGFAIFGSLSH